MKRLILIFVLASNVVAGLSGCGVKSDLIKPNGQATPPTDHDPSKPPQPLGR